MSGQPPDGTCGEVRELIPEFALGALTGADASEVVEHTARCVACRSRLVDLSGVTDALLVLAPEREPAPGFTARVRAAIDAESTPRDGSWRRRTWIALAAAAAVLALVAGGVAIGRANDSSSSSTAAGDIVERTMIGAGGRAAGHAFLYGGERPWAAVSVDYGTLPPGEYSVSTSTASHDATVGRVRVDADGRGAWGGTLADRGVHSVRIVDDAGHVLCEARFRPAQSADISRS